jgi:integrase
VAAFTGLREGEICGLRWSDYNGEELKVQRTVWRTHVGETKNVESEASVPVISVLRDLLEEHRSRGRAQTHDFIFSGGKKGFSLNLDNLSRRVVKPAIGDRWRGWHAFRRGLGTNLSELGVDDGIIQTLLRHAITPASSLRERITSW